MKSFRERYFEDYSYCPTEKGGLFSAGYLYQGLWCKWAGSSQKLLRMRAADLLLGLAGLFCFFAAALQRVSCNSDRLVALFSLLSLIPFAAELWGILRFAFSRTFFPLLDCKIIRSQLLIGSLLHSIFLFVSGLLCLVHCFQISRAPAVLAVAAGYCGSAVCSLLVFALHRTLGYRTFKNQNGKVGEEI